MNEKLKDLIEKSGYAGLQKNVMIGFVERANIANEARAKDRELIEQTAREKKVFQVVVSTDEVKIYTVVGKDDWDVKYPYRVIFLNSKGVWERCDTVSATLDEAFVTYLGVKHTGSNSQFAKFALKMLGIKTVD